MAEQLVALAGEGVLLTLARIGVTLAGLASIVGALRRRERWTEPQVEGLRFLVEWSLAARVARRPAADRHR